MVRKVLPEREKVKYMFGIDWNHDGKVDFWDDMITMELLEEAEEDEEDDE